MLTDTSPTLRRFLVSVAAIAAAFALMTAAAALPARAATEAAQPAMADAADQRLKPTLADHRDRGGPNLHHGDRRREVRGPHGRPPQYRPPHYRPPHAHRPQVQPRWPHHPRAVVLPANCEVRTSGRHGPRMAYLARCLHHAGLQRHLPRRCEMPVRLRGQNVLAYDQHCLIEAGYRTQGRIRR